MRIDHIEYPYVFTDNGRRINIKNLKGTPRVGAELTEALEVLNVALDPDCVNGVCPIK